MLQKIRLRPKKYAGKEIIADIKLKEEIKSVSSSEALDFKLTLGDAISRKFNFTNPDIKSIENIYAEDKNADWLENASAQSYKVRLRFLCVTDWGIHHDNFTGEPIEHLSIQTGYRLLEVINETKIKENS